MLELMLWLLLLVIAVGVFLMLVPYRLMPNRYYTLLNKMPGPKGYPFIGNGLMLNISNDGAYPLLTQLCKDYDPIFRFHALGWTHIPINDLESIEKVLTSMQHITKSTDYKFLKPWLGDGLLISTGSKWQSRRKILTAAFHFKILEDYMPIFNRNSKILVEKLWEHIDEPFVKIQDFITLCTLDIICETAMGTSINAQDGQEVEYVKAVHRMAEMFQLRQLSLWLYRDIPFKLSITGREQARILKTLHGFTEKVIQQRRAEYSSNKKTDPDNVQRKKRHLAFLDLLIEVSETGHLLTDQDIREEVDTFMFEGHDTTSAALSWALHLLGLNPDVQDKVAQELQDIFGDSDRPTTYEDLNQMRYLEQVIKEALRLYPSVPMFSRLVESEFEIKGYTIPVGANVTLLPVILHRNPELYPEPEKFDPDRFLPEACQKRHPFAYLPFSAGPRNCIGQRFAMMEEKVVLSTVLRNFRLESLDQPQDIKLLLEMILKSKDPLRVKLTPRK